MRRCQRLAGDDHAAIGHRREAHKNALAVLIKHVVAHGAADLARFGKAHIPAARPAGAVKNYTGSSIRGVDASLARTTCQQQRHKHEQTFHGFFSIDGAIVGRPNHRLIALQHNGCARTPYTTIRTPAPSACKAATDTPVSAFSHCPLVVVRSSRGPAFKLQNDAWLTGRAPRKGRLSVRFRPDDFPHCPPGNRRPPLSGALRGLRTAGPFLFTNENAPRDPSGRTPDIQRTVGAEPTSVLLDSNSCYDICKSLNRFMRAVKSARRMSLEITDY